MLETELAEVFGLGSLLMEVPIPRSWGENFWILSKTHL